MKKSLKFTIIAWVIFSIFTLLAVASKKLISMQAQESSKPVLPSGVVTAYTPPQNLNNENIVFPSDGGVINVKNVPYYAKGDGITDDTAAIQKALNSFPNGNKIIYIPNGTYLVSNQLQWPSTSDGNSYKRTILQGQNTAGTIIKLKNSAPGFTNLANPKAVIWTGTAPAQRFRNAIRNLTVDTGTGNAGAVGIQFIANNQGAIRNVTIRSGDRQGVTGLDMGYTDEVGPLLVKNLKVTGFNVGIRTANTVNSQTFEHIILEKQNESGLLNNGQVISIRGLKSSNAVAAINNINGLVTLLDATLTGTGNASNQPAINNEATIFARNLTTSGYQIAIRNTNGTRQNTADSSLAEFVSHPIHSLFTTPLKSLNLPIQETPEVPWDALSEWISPTRYGAVPNDNQDDSTAIQAAIDSGKTTVYLPNGSYDVNKTIYIRKNVRRIIGLEARIAGTGVFRFSNGSTPVVVMERLNGVGGGIVHDSSTRTLVLSSMTLAVSGGSASYSNTSNATGNLFFEDVVGSPLTFNKQKVWARQLNVENATKKIVNNGGTLWILGLKTERGSTIVDTRAGGKTEVAGAFIYSTSDPKGTTPMFTNDQSSLSVTSSECNYNGNFYNILVREMRTQTTRTLNRGNIPQRCNGSVLPLYVGYQ